MEKIRDLKADEIECRVQSVVQTAKGTGCILLLYKDARCDMRILDETFGQHRWQRKHYECKGNLFCSVGVFFGDDWVWKDDCGTESNTEKEKGESSDSFKRACFNWGIGRELYTSPFIWINLESSEFDASTKPPKLDRKLKFSVSSITIEDKKITALSITDNKGNTRFTYGNKAPEKKPVSDEELPFVDPEAKISSEKIKELGALCVKQFGKEQSGAMFTATTGLTSRANIKNSEYDSVYEKIKKANKL